MNSERDTTRIVQSWLENGVTDLPDRVLDPVLDQLPTTPQRRHPWQARRFNKMNSTLKIAIAAAAVVVIGIVGLTRLQGSSVTGVAAGPSPAPTATGAPSQSPEVTRISPLPTSGVVFEPGRYRIANLSVQVPAGWRAGDNLIAKDYGPSHGEEGALFAVWQIAGTFVDPCTDHRLVRPSPGPGIEQLAVALADQPGTQAAPPRAVTVDGYPAEVVDVTVTTDIETCGTDGFWLWASPEGDRRYVQGNNELNRIYVVDVHGERLTFNGRVPARTTAADRAELDAIIASIQIEP
jgi:hypothetical protein